MKHFDQGMAVCIPVRKGESNLACPFFQPSVEYNTGGTSPSSITSADFNKDGRIDLAVVDIGSNDVSILLNNGSGVFSVSQTIPFSTLFPGSVLGQIAAADFNGDGSSDLAVTDQSSNNRVFILFNNGDGTFAAPVAYSTGVFPVVSESFAIAIGDFDGVNGLDLAIANRGQLAGTSFITVLLNDGSGVFSMAPGSPFDTNPGLAPTDIVAADYNGDGKLDLATANRDTNDVTVFSGNGNGTFQTPGVSFSVLPGGSSPSSLVSADLNGDGVPDIAVANNATSNVTVFLNDGFGSFTEPMGSPFSLGTDAFPFDIAAADFNCDGFIDLATPNEGSDNVSVLINDGTGEFSTPFQFPTGAGPFSITVADFNGDGRVDIATANEDSSNVSVLLNGCVQPPTCPPDMVVPCPIVNYPTPVSLCPGVTVTCFPPSGSLFPVGDTDVTCTAQDIFGNTEVCSFTITVMDEPPTITCPEDITVLVLPGQTSATVTYEVTATDICGVTSITCHGITRSFSPPAPIAVATFTMDFPVGMTMLTCTARDQSGNMASCSFVVTVTSGVSNSIQPEIIRVKKVYDWVVFQSNFRLILDLNRSHDDQGNQK
ncbi:FG-GAP-like repeat-containing protein [Brevibacillus porteri]|nr:FG-GAP-like repeat-containing protein [Brevibacillus porteri]MED1798509.1 FG-GAP-like repeat-containing protein [Brevibacillus porteri]MED2134373.1 FG-GAP-like repeat-containing protein [Brevibacillus porteri]MED2746765.1 FG-GAP-like repeat-containing protein [Brevibacillus porteri]MED2818053.1 FG-GAP-like repeat-containing protein [Brevibacillus porteri]MED2897638.1 FG-GAP-like repeat-containing protein [Brevibacillus porteri]